MVSQSSKKHEISLKNINQSPNPDRNQSHIALDLDNHCQTPPREKELCCINKSLYHPTRYELNGFGYHSTPTRGPFVIACGPISIIEQEDKLYWRIGYFGYLQKMRQGNFIPPVAYIIEPISYKDINKRAVELMLYDAIRIKSKIPDSELLYCRLGHNHQTLEDICTLLNLS